MKKFRRLIASMRVILLAVVGFAGCGPKDDAAPAEGTALGGARRGSVRDVVGDHVAPEALGRHAGRRYVDRTEKTHILSYLSTRLTWPNWNVWAWAKSVYESWFSRESISSSSGSTLLPLFLAVVT